MHTKEYTLNKCEIIESVNQAHVAFLCWCFHKLYLYYLSVNQLLIVEWWGWFPNSESPSARFWVLGPGCLCAECKGCLLSNQQWMLSFDLFGCLPISSVSILH